MHNILNGLKGEMCLIDDILVCSTTQEEDDKNLSVLHHIQDAGLTLYRARCELNKSSIKFLDQVVDPSGIKPDPDKINQYASTNYPQRIQKNSGHGKSTKQMFGPP